MAFAVLSDTSGNIPKKLLEEKNIPVIPFVYSYDGEDHVCEDVENFDAKEFYSLLARGKEVTTTQISPSGYADFFRPFLNDGLDVIQQREYRGFAPGGRISREAGSSHRHQRRRSR